MKFFLEKYRKNANRGLIISQDILAIDFGSKYLKMLQLKGSKAKELKFFGSLKVPEQVLNGGEIADKSKLISLMNQLRSKIGNIGKIRTCISLSSDIVSVKLLKLNKSEEDEFDEEEVIVQAERLLEIDISNVYYDYQVLRKIKNTNHSLVAFVSCDRGIVDEYIDVIVSSGLDVGVVDVEPFSIVNMFEYNYGKLNSLSVIVDIGWVSSKMVFCFRGEYIYSKTIYEGSRSYVEAIAEELDLTSEEAEVICVHSSVKKTKISDQAKSAVNIVNKMICEKIKDEIQVFISGDENYFDFQDAKYIFLAGGSSRILGLKKSLESIVSSKVFVSDSFNKVLVPSPLKERLFFESTFYSVAIGLATRTLDLKY